jgi:hypothetical protein
VIPLQKVKDDGHKGNLGNTILRTSMRGGGTSMYSAILVALENIRRRIADANESWIVCLTDGQSADSLTLIRDHLQRNSMENVHIVVIGVDLLPRFHGDMISLCSKFGDDPDGIFVPTSGSIEGIQGAFARAAAAIPVSHTFELDGSVTGEDCTRLMEQYLPSFVPEDSMLFRAFWFQFLYRRVSFFDKNDDFNYNEECDHLGETLLNTMLHEVESLLRQSHDNTWFANHRQLIYDFSDEDSPKFRLLCANPEELDSTTKAKLKDLKLPGFSIPSKSDLESRTTLDCYLSQALNIPLVEKEGVSALGVIDDNRFVLTLDFTIKLLNIHERVACGIPCIMEGETGVSKTALTTMYSLLINSALRAQAQKETLELLRMIESELTPLVSSSFSPQTSNAHTSDSIVERLVSMIGHVDTCNRIQVTNCLIQNCTSRSHFFQDLPANLLGKDDPSNAIELVRWLALSKVERTFFEMNVHSALVEKDFKDFFCEIGTVAKKLQPTGSNIVVFLDEINTSSVLGLLKEIVVDRSCCGQPLDDNIVVVAACNPSRSNLLDYHRMEREKDLGQDWVSGHYQVVHMQGSLSALMWRYGSLSAEQEKGFIFRRMEMLDNNVPQLYCSLLAELISQAQQAVRKFAYRDILARLQECGGCTNYHEEALSRAASVVSLRDIQRVFNIFHFLMNDFGQVLGSSTKKGAKLRRAGLLSVAVVHYLRLSEDRRSEFIDMLSELPTDIGEGLDDVLAYAMDVVVKGSVFPDRVALTRGLKENLFMVVVCSFSRTPLMIIGPPGCSKVRHHILIALH